MSNIVIYEDENIELSTTIKNDNIWLTQAELVILFGKDQSVISRHINNIFKDEEVDEKRNIA